MIAASTEAAMAVRTTGLYTILTSVWTWGSNIWGQLGDGTTTSRATPEEVSGINAPSIVGIAANNAFSAALGSDGTVWEWGSNNYGQLGDGTTTERLRPVEAIGLDSGITQISAGGSHVLALRSDGTVLAWGRNVEGQLGDGVTSTESLGQVQVSGLTGVTQVAAGYDHSLAVQRVFRVRLPLTAQHP
jgi:alpha-tubulin suppressor-like RCC1 family protein